MKFLDRVRFLFTDINKEPSTPVNLVSLDPHFKIIRDRLLGKPVDAKVLKESLQEALSTLVVVENWAMHHKFSTKDMPRVIVHRSIERIRNLIRP